MPFQHRYASLILDLERLNVELNKYLTGVQQCWQEVSISINWYFGMLE